MVIINVYMQCFYSHFTVKQFQSRVQGFSLFFSLSVSFFPHKSRSNLDLVLEFLPPDLLNLRICPIIQGKFLLFHSFNAQVAIFSF